MVSKGEYINTAATVSRVGASYFDYLNRGGWPAQSQGHGQKQAVQQAPTVNLDVSTQNPALVAELVVQQISSRLAVAR